MASRADDRGIYRDIFEASPDPVFVHDADTGEVLDANPAAAAMVGLDHDAVVGMGVGEFSPPGFTSDEATALIRTARDEGRSQVEWQVVGPDGDQRWVDVSLQRTTIDDTTRVVAYVRDVTEYRQAERQRRTERNMLDRLLDVSPVGIVIHDADGTIVRTNEQAEDILGVDRAELVGEGAIPDGFDVGPADADGPGIIPFQAAKDSGGSVEERELVVDRADGERRVLSTNATPLSDASGEVERVVVTMSDVTEQRERERARTEQTDRLQTLVDNLPVVVFTLDPEGVFTHSSGRGLESLGLEPGDLEGVSVFEAYAAYDDIVAAAELALDGEEVRVTQEIDDLVFETWYRPVFDDAGSLSRVVGVARDVTDLKRREDRVRQLSESTRELLYADSESAVAETVAKISRSIVGRPLTAMWSYDETDETLYPIGATAQATAFGGATPDVSPIGPGTDEKAIFDAGEPHVIEDYRTLENPSAPEVPLGTLLCLPLDDHGMLCIGSPSVESFDDTERHLIDILASTAAAALDRVERERDLREYREELERSNEALQQFAYVASHDLQEPLRMVSSYVDLLESEYGDQLDEEAQEYMDFATDGASRMQAMIDGLLEYSRIQTDASSFETVDADVVLDETLDQLAIFLEDEAVAIQRENLPPVASDRAQLSQLFQNLVKNAIRHGQASTIAVEATVHGDEVEFAVRDDGVGVPESQQASLFEVFEQGYETEEGSGMGLAICERIVHRHGGEIWVDSAPGDGTTFFFTLPHEAEGHR